MARKGYLLNLTFIFLTLILGFSTTRSQTIDKSKVISFIKSQQESWQMTDQDVGDLRIAQVVHTKHNGVQHVYLRQQVGGVDVAGANLSVHIAPNGKMYSVGNRIISDISSKLDKSSPKISVEEGLLKASDKIGKRSRSIPQLKSHDEGHLYRFEPGDISNASIVGQLKYVLNASEKYQLVWAYIISNKNDLWEVHIDAQSGEMISKESLTVHCRFEEGYLNHPHPNTASCLEQTALATIQAKPLTPSTTVVDGAQYKVIPLPNESPIFSERVMVVNPAHPEASPLGWHDSDGIEGPEYTITRGNNVYAYVDRNWDDGPDSGVSPDGGEALLFDYEADFSAEPITYQEAAVTNLFYVNNMMHDLSERYGFDEGAGNFQNENYGIDGVETDYVFAMAQRGADDPAQCGEETLPPNSDGSFRSCINNANFGTPPDGSNPAMRMFLWSSSAGNKFLRVDEPAGLEGIFSTGSTTDDWSVPITTTPVTGEVVIVDDGSISGSLGCNPIINDLSGKIAIIDRGSCDFSEKVLNAQNAGAIAAIICNYQEGIILMAPGIGAAQVNIPVVSVDASTCSQLRSVINDGLIVSLVASSTSGGPARLDGDFDNGIIAHEYTHGISNRLTGGSLDAGCLRDDESDSMGEGWSDFMALIATVRPGDSGETPRGMGNYVLKDDPTARGFRPFAYSTDMSINPHTYEDIAFELVPHGAGSVWCAMLWDLYWAFVDVYGFDEDVFDGNGGNNMAVQLVVDGMKFQPCNPGFVDSRDAILTADEVNNGGANKSLIWEVFARRGLGWGADQGSEDAVNDGRSSFEICPSCSEELSVSKEMTDFIVAGDEIEVNLLVGNYKDSDVNGVVIRDLIPQGANVILNSVSMPYEIEGEEIVFNIDAMTSQEEINISYRMETSTENVSISLFLDDMENGDDNWDIFFDELGGLQIWEVIDLFAYSGENAWFVQDTEEEADHWFQFRDPILIEDGQPFLRFFHNYETEPRADAGIVSISKDGGTNWTILDDEFIRNGYSGRVQYTTFAIPNLNGFWGTTDNTYIASYADLSAFIGEEVLIRWRFASDDNTEGLGWFIDDIEIMDLFNYNSEVCVTSAEGDQACALARSKGTFVETGIPSQVKVNELTEEEVRFHVYPNPANENLNISFQSNTFPDANISLSTIAGTRLWEEKVILSGATDIKSIDVSTYAAGMYYARISAGGKYKVVKFVLQ